MDKENINTCIQILNSKGIKAEYINLNPIIYSFDYSAYNLFILRDKKQREYQTKIIWYSDFVSDDRNELDTLHCLNVINYEYEGVKALTDDKGIKIVLDIYSIDRNSFENYFIDSLRSLVKAIEHFNFIKPD